MYEALNQAYKAILLSEVPVGAVIVERDKQTIVARAHNKVESNRNTLMHAEIIALNIAMKKLKIKFLDNYDMYVTLEPCAMCASAISYTRIGRLFYSASDYKQGAVENGIRLFTNDNCLNIPEVYSGILEKESSDLMKKFFDNIRKN